jgi:hypothetical protein
MTGHPDITEIADLAEGLLPPARTTDLRRHLGTCEPCSDVYTSLEEIQGLLGALPEPQRMPDDVATRIDAALAAEALTSTAPPQALEEAGTAGTRVSRETTTSTDRPSGHTRPSTTGPGRKDRNRGGGGRRRRAALGAVAAAAALGLGSVIVASLTGDGPAGETARGQQTSLVDTFSEGRLKKQVDKLVTDGQDTRGGSRTPRSFGTESENEAENHVFTRPAVPECIQKAIGRDDAALATEEGVYKGKEALLVVLPDALNGSRVSAYIVESACVHEPAAGRAEVLLKRSYARP